MQREIVSLHPFFIFWRLAVGYWLLAIGYWLLAEKMKFSIDYFSF